MSDEHRQTRDVVVSAQISKSETDQGVDVNAIPVRVSFNAGRVMLPFETLQKIAPGYVFELNKRLDDQVITIHANDSVIAYGELVAVGDLIGVRVTRMLTTG